MIGAVSGPSQVNDLITFPRFVLSVTTDKADQIIVS